MVVPWRKQRMEAVTTFWDILVGAGIAVSVAAGVVFMTTVKVGAWSDDRLHRWDEGNGEGTGRDRRHGDPRC